jgi:hypothetical protein
MKEFEWSIRLSPENGWVYHNRAQVYGTDRRYARVGHLRPNSDQSTIWSRDISLQHVVQRPCCEPT